MMGTKVRTFSPLPHDLSLENLVPPDHFYRRLQARLDLSFVRELVAPLYAGGGRPSVDPVVFFKLQLMMFFEDLRSERQLMRVVADRLSLRWYLGYDLFEPLPDHSSLTRIRERFGLEVFRRFFEQIVQECLDAGLVWGRRKTRVGGSFRSSDYRPGATATRLQRDEIRRRVRASYRKRISIQARSKVCGAGPVGPGPSRVFRGYRSGAMQDPGSVLWRRPHLRGWVNKPP